MIFNPDPLKQAQEIVFSRKAHERNHENVYVPVIRENIRKHLGLFLDSKLDYINEKIKKTKGVNVMRKMNLLLPRSSMLTIYKSFLRPHLDYHDVIYPTM